MKSIRIHSHGNIDVLDVKNLSQPLISDNKVKVQIKAASMNHLDIWVRNGLPGIPIPLPLTLGSDAAGLVVEVGKNVKKFKLNDKVVIQPGTFNIECKEVFKVSKSLSVFELKINSFEILSNLSSVRSSCFNIQQQFLFL